MSVLAQVSVVLLVLTSLALLVSQDWRYSLLALAFQYVGVVILVGTQWPVGLAATKLVVGWMTSATLAFTQFSQKEQRGEKPWTPGWAFRLVAAAFVLLFVFSLATRINLLLPAISAPQVEGSLVLIGVGLLQLGMSSSPFRVVLGLLTFLSGFEIIYSAVEVSVLVAGMLAAVTLGLALVGTYLIVYSTPEDGGSA